MPIFIGPEGCGKGIILSHPLLPVFDKCGLHRTNFDTVTDHFNAALEHEVFIIVDEGSESLYTQSTLPPEGCYVTHALRAYNRSSVALVPFS